jgi:hypothetical protein
MITSSEAILKTNENLSKRVADFENNYYKLSISVELKIKKAIDECKLFCEIDDCETPIERNLLCDYLERHGYHTEIKSGYINPPVVVYWINK